jgi:acyl-CoA thioesterase
LFKRCIVETKIFEAIRRRVENEPYARKLGLKVLRIGRGHSMVEMTLTEEMANIFGGTHGGAIFSLVDEAFETASNSHGTIAVALSVNITYVKAPSPGDTLVAEANEVESSRRIGHYEIKVRNGKSELIAVCQAMAYRREEKLPFLRDT